MPVKEFCRSVKSNQLFDILERAFRQATGRTIGRSERDSWVGSLPRITGVLELRELSESVHVGLEVQIPYYSQRVDVALYGYDAAGQPHVLLVELKQWSEVEIDEDSLYVRMRTGLVQVVHPSVQASGYRRHLANFVKAFHNEPAVQVSSCVYAHNYPHRAGLRWVDSVFELSDADPDRVLQSPETFDLQVYDSPAQVLDWVRARNATEPNSARLTAGWCWPWSDPQPDGTLVNDITFADFAFPWELKNGKKGKRGIPEAKHWAVDPAGAEQAGTVYSVQGFEFRHVGVLMGPDLLMRDGQWIANPRANFRNSIRAKPPEVASVYLRRIYRALFTRPLRSARVYSVDPETREFLRSRVTVAAREHKSQDPITSRIWGPDSVRISGRSGPY
jgi:hypothetical protein